MNLYENDEKLKKIDPTQTPAWEKLQEHYNVMKSVHMRDLFAADPERFNRFSLRFNDILFDYSKNIITPETMQLLLNLAEETDVKDAIDKMFRGDQINETENRAVLHVALRNHADSPIYFEHEDVMPQVQAALQKMQEFSEKIISGSWLGYSGKAITDIVNIGIGGSDLGPFMVTEALRPYKKVNLNVHFVSNVDGTHIVEVLRHLDPETTLFLIASKTFTTSETMLNANTAKKWFLNEAQREETVKQHFVAISTNSEKVKEFGIDPENMFVFWDWVGGRFSLWGSIGLSIACAIGYENFAELLEGAYQMDQHFRNTPFNKNIPVLMALLSIWYNNFFRAQSEAVIPYDQYLQHLPSYLQQLSMESNGKSVDRNGKFLSYETGAILWGKPGTNGQHAFFQLIHQGTKLIPCDFIAAAISHNPVGEHQQMLLANFFAQTEALMKGKTEAEARAELQVAGKTETDIRKLLPYKIFAGNKPTNTFLIKQITPFSLGSLIAMYEHKIFVQGIIWNIFSFDQWGVELGKALAKTIIENLEKKTKIKDHDASTNGLVNACREFRKNIAADADRFAALGFAMNNGWQPSQLSEMQYKILLSCQEQPLSSNELCLALERRTKSGNLKRALSALKERKYLAFTIPEIPGSSNQKYRLTKKGLKTLEQHEERKKMLLNRLQVIKGDITTLKVDAIVNAANTSLLGGGGVDGAIHRAAGPDLLKECRKIGACPTGEVRLSGGYRLPAKYVIHAVGPVWHGGKTKENLLLTSCYKNSLETAVKNGIRTIAFPAISCGVYRFPIDQAAQIAVQEVKKFIDTNSAVDKVIFVCFDDETYRTYQQTIEALF